MTAPQGGAAGSAPTMADRQIEQIAADATEVLRRAAARDRQRADLLFELLGALGYYAGNGARVVGRSQYGPIDEPLSRFVDEFRRRADDIAKQ